MKVISMNKIETMRKERNKDVLRRMRNGESLSSFTSQSSWYPPRPVIEKDDRAIASLYGQKIDKRIRNALRRDGKAVPDSDRTLQPAG